MRECWNWVVFTAALFATASLVIEFIYELPEHLELVIEDLDLAVLAIFAVDLFNEHGHFKGSGIRFTREHWLDIMAVIPLFRIVRISKLAKLEELATLEETAEVRRGMEVEETVSKSIHARRLKKEDE